MSLYRITLPRKADRPCATRRLTHAVIVNVSYPTRANGRGTLEVPEMHVGAATLPLLAALVRRKRPDCRIRAYDEITTRARVRQADDNAVSSLDAASSPAATFRPWALLTRPDPRQGAPAMHAALTTGIAGVCDPTSHRAPQSDP